MPSTTSGPAELDETAGRRRTRRRRAVAIAGFTVVALIATSVVLIAVSERQDTPDVAELAGSLAEQEVRWESCDFAPGDPTAEVDTSNVTCATIEVPKDWHDADPDETWDIRVSYAENIDPSDPFATTLFVHAGGPFPSLSFSATTQHRVPELRSSTNFLSFDQRGLGRSSTVTCDYAYDPARGPAALPRAIGDTCADDPDLATMTTEQVAYDMDFMRHLLGLEKVSYLGYSYGTWLGTWFGKLFPDSIERMVLDSPSDGTSATYEMSWTGQDVAIDRQLRLLTMNWLARNDASYALGDDPEAIWDRYFAATGSEEMAEAAYLVWASTGAATLQAKPVSSELIADVMTRLVAEGESAGTGGPVKRATRVVEALDIPEASRDAALAQFPLYAAVPPVDEADGLVRATHSSADDFLRCTDGEWTQGQAHWDAYNARMAEQAPFTAQLKRLDAPPVCAFWPTEVVMPDAADDFPETLVLQSELDPLTPWEQGRALGAALPNTSLIAVDNEGVHGVFPYGTDDVDRPVIDFLLGAARRPASTVVAAKPLPLESGTFEYWTPLSIERREGDPRFSAPMVPAPTGR